MEKDEARTLTVDQAHRMIGKRNISRGALYLAIKRGEIPYLKLGKRILIPRAALLAWLESATLPAAQTHGQGGGAHAA